MKENATITKNTWKRLMELAQKAPTDLILSNLFEKDPQRFETFSMNAPGVFIDFSKQQVSTPVVDQLIMLAQECNLSRKRDAMINGEFVNTTENRQVLHTALRSKSSPYANQVETARRQMLEFGEKIRFDDSITDIVNIGTGGSDLGPRMTTQALTPFSHSQKRFHFVSNMDAFEISTVLQKIDPNKTLFIITSKTFTTQETLANAITAKAWFEASGNKKFSDHFVAVTADAEKAKAFGIEHIFSFWEWVGGRYSVWSSVGLSLAIAIGEKNFEDFLSGAHDMDAHFASAPLKENAPVILALIDIWNRNFLSRPSRCVAPYHQGLARLPAYLQQLEMESNGKSVSTTGETLDYPTSGVVWGEAGNNGQHAFFQMLHQGADVIPVDFILIKNAIYPSFLHNKSIEHLLEQQHISLLMNGLAQSRALMIGKNFHTALEELQQKSPDLSLELKQQLAKHQTFSGNRPSTTMLIDQLTPYNLGSLIALHEHRTAATGMIWNINSFDQWGVELGKDIAKKLTQQLNLKTYEGLDDSTKGLMQLIQ